MMKMMMMLIMMMMMMMLIMMMMMMMMMMVMMVMMMMKEKLKMVLEMTVFVSRMMASLNRLVTIDIFTITTFLSSAM